VSSDLVAGVILTAVTVGLWLGALVIGAYVQGGRDGVVRFFGRVPAGLWLASAAMLGLLLLIPLPLSWIGAITLAGCPVLAFGYVWRSRARVGVGVWERVLVGLFLVCVALLGILLVRS
jgi:hypothetical protein